MNEERCKEIEQTIESTHGFRFRVEFDESRGPRGVFVLKKHGDPSGHFVEVMAIELQPNTDIERSVRLQIECMWPECGNFALTRTVWHEQGQRFRFCDDHVIRVIERRFEHGAFADEARRRGILAS